MILNNNYLFDSIYYINNNPDLIENNINTCEKAWKHYIMHGIHEGRDCMKNDNTYFFDHDFYAKKYKDLIENGIYTKHNLLKHWNNNGLFEDRMCNEWEETCQLEYNYENEIRGKMKLYKYNTNLFDFIKKYGGNINHDVAKVNENNYLNSFYNKNCINFDLYFYKYVNNIQIFEKFQLLDHLYENAFDGLIYHPNQLKNIYEDINVYKYGKKLIYLPKKMKYRLNTAPAIWRKSALKKYTKKNDTPWSWELFGSLRTISDEGFYCVNSKDSIISYYNNGGMGGVIHRGLWAKGAPLWIKNNLGIDVLSGSFRLEENNQSVNKRSFLWKLNFIIAGLRSTGIRGLLLILSMYVDKLRKK
jgi:hypothetical protein